MIKRTWLTLNQVAQDPKRVTFIRPLHDGSTLTIRPLLPEDAPRLAVFFDQLGTQTGYFYSVAEKRPEPYAQALCQAINRYDKLRFVAEIAENKGAFMGLIEFSFSILDTDKQRYAAYNISLSEKRDCRYGLCLSDQYQNQGLGGHLFTCAKEVARQFGKERIILWGGVYGNNGRAIAHYQKNRFERLGNL